MKGFLSSLSLAARIGLGLGVALILAATAGAVWSVSTPSYATLFNELRDSDAAEIAKQLDEWKVPYQITDEGHALAVEAPQVHATRLRLVSAGVPSGGRVGFELFKDSNFGVTEFAQRVNFQRALQGELERTISAFDAVASARVHLNLRESNGLLSRDQPAKASIALSLRPQARLSPQQVHGIQNLVAAAVESLDPAAVVVLDEKGQPLNVDEDAIPTAALTSRLAEQASIEQHLHKRVAAILDRVFDRADYRIGVDVALNLDRVSRETERLQPQGVEGAGLIVRERRTARPAATPAANPAVAADKRDTALQTEVEYQHGREHEQLIEAPGRIDKLSVAVVVPKRLGEDGVAKLRDLIAAAVGLQPERGDRLEVVALLEPIAPRADVPVADRASQVLLEPVAAARWDTPVLIAAAGTILLSLLLGVSAGHRLARRRSLPPREREQAMLQIQSWLNEGSPYR